MEIIPVGGTGANEAPSAPSTIAVDTTNRGTNGTPVWKGDWSDSVTYRPGQAVYYQGSAWVAKVKNTDVPPTEGTHWGLLAQKGADGTVISDDTLGVLDPDTAPAAVDEAAAMVEQFGGRVKDYTVAGTKYILGTLVTEQPETVQPAFRNTAQALKLLQFGQFFSTSRLDALEAQTTGGLPMAARYSGKYMRVNGYLTGQFVGPSISDWEGDFIEVIGLFRVWDFDPGSESSYAEWWTCVMSLGPDPVEADLWESAVFHDGHRLYGFQEDVPRGGNDEVGNVFAPGGIAIGKWCWERHVVSKSGYRAIYRRVFNETSERVDEVSRGMSWQEVARKQKGSANGDADYWVADPTGLPWRVGAGATCVLDVAQVKMYDGSGLRLGFDANDATDDTVPALGQEGEFDAEGTAGVRHTDDDPEPVYSDTDLFIPASDASSFAQASALGYKADLVDTPDGPKLATSQIPAVAIIKPTAVPDIASMLALDVQQGDIAVVQDTGDGQPGVYIVAEGGDPTTIEGWLYFDVPAGAVVSINGQNGTVVLVAGDVGAYSKGEVDTLVAAKANTSALSDYATLTYLSSTLSGYLATTTVGSTVQAYNANLAALAGLTGAANKLAYFTGPGAMALATLGTAASASTSDFATAAQGTTADAAVPKALYDANTILAANTDNTPAALTVGASTHVGRKATGDIVALTPSESKVILGAGSASGLATLDTNGKLTFTESLPPTVFGSVASDVLVPAFNGVTAGTILVKDRAYFVGVFLPYSANGWDRIYTYISTGQAGSSCFFGLHAATGSGRPGTLIADSSGATTATTSSSTEVYGAISVSAAQAPPGWYFLSIVATGSGTMPTPRGATNPAPGWSPSLPTASAATLLNTSVMAYAQSSVTGSMPNPPVVGSFQPFAPVLAIRSA